MRIELIKMFKDKKFLKEIAIILIVGIIVNASCFLLCSITGHCTNETSQYFPMTQNDKNFPMSDIFNYVSVDFEHNENLSDYYCFMSCKDDVSGRWHGFIIFTDNMWLAEQNSSGTSFNAQSSTVQNVFYCYEYSCSNSFSWKNVYNRGPSKIRGVNFESSIFDIHSSYLSNFQVGFYVYDYACLIGPDNSVSVGDFIDLPGLDEILNNITNTWQPPSNITGHALPSQPTENPNNNDFQNRLQMFEYLKDSINAIVGNLGYNIKNWFDNLIAKMVEGFNSVSQNIWNGFKTLMDNIKDFFGPKIDTIIEKFNYITEPFDSQKLFSNLNNANFSSDFLGLITTVSSFGTALTSGTEPSSCSFTLDFSNSYYNFGVCEFSLDWILPFRSIIRLIVGCLCVYSLIISIFTSLNTYIGGTSSINDDI